MNFLTACLVFLSLSAVTVQESQAAIGYSWSGTYAVPGGGIANCIMRNDLKRLGLKRQRFGVIEWYGDDNV